MLEILVNQALLEQKVTLVHLVMLDLWVFLVLEVLKAIKAREVPLENKVKKEKMEMKVLRETWGRKVTEGYRVR